MNGHISGCNRGERDGVGVRGGQVFVEWHECGGNAEQRRVAKGWEIQ